MARTTLPLLALILTLSHIVVLADNTPAKLMAHTNFIKASCGATTYSQVCIRSLSKYATEIQESPLQLTQTALSVTLARVESTKANMLKLTIIKGLKPIEYGALKDCLDQVEDSMDRLSQSVRELEKLGQAQDEEDISWHLRNVEAWTNTAQNQVRSCAGEFSSRALDGKIKDSVQAQTSKVGHLMSIALELVQLFEVKQMDH